MIRLVINAGSQSETLTFQKKTVVIGSESGGSADLSLKSERLQPVHLKIIDEGGRFLIFNVANDPFTTLNDLPFGKKTLKNHDILQVGKTLVSFEGKKSEAAAPADYPRLDTEKELVLCLEEGLERPAAPEPEQKEPQEPSSFDVEALIREAEALEEEGDALSEDLEESEEEPVTAAPEPAEEEDEEEVKGEQQKRERDEPPPFRLTSKIRWALFAGTALLLILLVAVGAYIRLLHTSKKEELNAAGSAADIALALTFAQINGIKPPLQNWSDPQFLKSSISQVLAPNKKSMIQIDARGNLTHVPYLIKVYTSNDMSHFIIVAHPQAGLAQWVAPKKSIIIDSKAMELRKIDDLKILNDILNRNINLNETAIAEIQGIAHEGELIELKELANNQNENGFLPPKTLGYLRPGAENLVYNAPRYSQVGERLMQQAIRIATYHRGTSEEVKRLRTKLQEVEKLPNAVIYTTEGLRTAQAAQKALETLSPHHQYLIAYLKIDPKTKGTGSHLLLESDIPITDQEAVHEGKIGPFSREQPPSEGRKPQTPNLFAEEVDSDHPLFLQLSLLAEKRREAVEPVADRMVAVLHQQNRRPLPHFKERFDALLTQYLFKLEEQEELIREELGRLQEEWRELPTDQFTAFAKGTELEPLLEPLPAEEEELPEEKSKEVEVQAPQPEKPLPEPPSLLKEPLPEPPSLLKEPLPEPPPLLKEPRPLSFAEIEMAQSWEELEAATASLFRKTDDSQRNLLRERISQKLDAFIIHPETALPESAFTPINRVRLSRILRNSYIRAPEERSFYIGEFEERSARKGRL